MWDLPIEVVLYEEWVELPESEAALNRRVEIGIRDCEFLLEVSAELGGEGSS